MEKIIKFVENEISGICTAHDFYHLKRVYKLSKIIYESEKKGDKEVILISALLHEFLDKKFFSENIFNQKNKVLEILNNSGISKEKVEKIIFILENIGYGKSLSRKEKIDMIEFQIVEDADRIESIGAISIARTFAYGGKKGIPIYDPKIKFDDNLTEEKYGNSSTSINHFYEKLLNLKDLMNTNKAKEIANEKHKFLELFLKEFYKEWNCDY